MNQISEVRMTGGGMVVVLNPNRLMGACLGRGWSLTRLAREARVSRPTISTALRGNPVRPLTAWKLARALAREEQPSGMSELLED